MKSRKHIIYGWTARRSKLPRLLVWRWTRGMRLLRTGDEDICKRKDLRCYWCAADYPPKRVKVTVEEVCKPPNTEPIPLGRWFPVARKVKQTCCKCGHHMHLWLRVRKGAVEIKVTP